MVNRWWCGHLVALVPGQRPGQLGRQVLDRCGERVGDRLGLVVAVGQRDQHQEPGRAFDQGRDRAHALAEDQVAFPVTGHRAVLGFGRAFADVEDVRAGRRGRRAAGRLGRRIIRRCAGRRPVPFAAHRATARTGCGRCSRATPASPGRRGRSASASRRSAAATSAASFSATMPASTGFVGQLARLGSRRPRPRLLVSAPRPDSRDGPPLAATSRLIVDGARPSPAAIARSDSPPPGRARSPHDPPSQPTRCSSPRHPAGSRHTAPDRSATCSRAAPAAARSPSPPAQPSAGPRPRRSPAGDNLAIVPRATTTSSTQGNVALTH